MTGYRLSLKASLKFNRHEVRWSTSASQLISFQLPLRGNTSCIMVDTLEVVAIDHVFAVCW